MKNRFTVGRDQGADIPIADASVSRLHAEVSPVESGRLFVTDCNSSNGTFLIRAGVVKQVKQETLLGTDHVKFGNVTLPVSAVLDVIRQKGGGAAPAPAPRAASPKDALPSAVKLVRCDCGAVKPQTGRCPGCGQ